MLCIQDPEYKNSVLLNEALLEVCENACYGAGTYAFVSAEGIDLLMNNSIFETFIEKGSYELIIGMDDITNSNTLVTVKKFQNKYKNLSVKAFVHTTQSSVYHPKFSWFKCEEGGYLVTGSGNLTHKGLRKNREAYVLEKLTVEQIAEIEVQWKEWISSCREYLLDIDDLRVIEKAEENKRKRYKNIDEKVSSNREKKRKKEVIEKRKAIECEDENGAWSFSEEAAVLLAEIPVGRDRKLKKWCQANFDIETLKTFFGTKPNAKYEVILRCITNEGLILNIEKRQVISKGSVNYCFELTPPKDTLYPEEGRPIGVFVKIAMRTFLYMIIMPEDEYHDSLRIKLDKNRIREDRMVRCRLNVKELIAICEDLPILDYVE
ncbi:MAG: hypothetical protein K2K54_00570 [Lachnospiraceae bacterium]|nr:hypothetical protein [Lachnospiraceae bacterium]